MSLSLTTAHVLGGWFGWFQLATARGVHASQPREGAQDELMFSEIADAVTIGDYEEMRLFLIEIVEF